MPRTPRRVNKAHARERETDQLQKVFRLATAPILTELDRLFHDVNERLEGVRAVVRKLDENFGHRITGVQQYYEAAGRIAGVKEALTGIAQTEISDQIINIVLERLEDVCRSKSKAAHGVRRKKGSLAPPSEKA